MIHRVLVRETLHRRLADHLLSRLRRGEYQEEACLALWHRGDGVSRYTGVLGEIILPENGDRSLHGNVTVHSGYMNRVLDLALKVRAGVAVIHSHPGSGWQALSDIDEHAERDLIAPFIRETRLPLLGMTMGADGCWSARFWRESGGGAHPAYCREVRRVGTRSTSADYRPGAHPPYVRRESLVRTLDCWGFEAQARLARTHVCVVGAGSVGSIVLECLARTGFEEITIVDPDRVEDRNLDRLVYADRSRVGLRKVEAAAARLRRVATAARPLIRPVPLSVRTEQAYRSVADADVILCCVDNAEAREVLNHVAYSNCIPLIDGGVLVEARDRLLSAKWRVHLVGPEMRCLRCRGQYTSSDARDERMGIRRRGRYIDDGEDRGPEPGQNTMAFCNAVAAEEMRILIRYLVGQEWWHDTGPTSGQWSSEHRFVEAETDWFEHPARCVESCEFSHKRLGLGANGRPTYPFLQAPRDGWRERLSDLVRWRLGRMGRRAYWKGFRRTAR
ncbi:MAG: ThiF family adenylyltransferase [Gemmatimonadota bacterium]|nr:ThiF family adenylyltransferase [Gemmatimonadota bacterium]